MVELRLELKSAYDVKFERQLELVQETEEGGGFSGIVTEESVDVTETIRSEFVEKLRVLSKDTAAGNSRCD